MPRRAAFFDVDGTLLTGTSLFRFFAHDLAARGYPPGTYEAAMRELAAIKAKGATREAANRTFFAFFAGRSVAELTAEGERWFAAELATGSAFHPRVLAALRGHRAAGDLIVLLSGSFRPCLAPVARHVDADMVVCTEPEIVSGRYTGAVPAPMVGPRKAYEARALAERHGIGLAGCFSYGDDASDLPVLVTVGKPVVVGNDPVLARHAARGGWTRIPQLVLKEDQRWSSR